MGAILDGKWVILELIGKGAMGEVYRAHQSNLKRDVAIKVISEEVLAELGDDPQEREIAFGRFEREVQTMARVRHTNILNTYDYGEVEAVGDSVAGKVAFIVMEYIPGNSLRFTMDEEGLDDAPEEYVTWLEKYFLPVLDGVEVLHNNDIVHRDLKPENIFMDGEVPKIADFGLARSRHMKAVTTSLEMLGTLAYMSPEQSADFKNAGFETDIYALGKILYEAARGTLSEKTLPFTSVSLETTDSLFWAEMSAVIETATAVTTADRFQTVTELRTALLKCLSIYREEQFLNPQGELSGTGVPLKKESSGAIKKLVVSIGIFITIAGITGVYYFYENSGSSGVLDGNNYSNHDASLLRPQTVIFAADEDAAMTITGRDGSRMILTGSFDIETATAPFYLDEQKVTNFMFTEFLNSIKNELSVKNGIVRKDDTIVSYINTGTDSSEAIFYEHDTFHLKEQASGIRPATRVTFHGAHLYATHYGKQLLTHEEWEFAYRFHLDNPAQVSGIIDRLEAQSGSTMMHTNSIDRSSQTGKGALKDMGDEVREWVNISAVHRDDSSSPELSFVAGIMDESTLTEDGLPARRAPWEGFEDVGFRTKVGVIKR